MQGSWTTGMAEIAGIAGTLVLAALLVFLILRALLRRGRYRVVDAFGDEERRAVREAIVEVERRTVGEILPVVVERSDPHPAADWLAALSCLLAGSALLTHWLPWGRPLPLLLLQIALGGVGLGLARLLPDFKRLFIFESRATDVCEEQAFQEFYANGLHRTAGATGVLLFVSLLERRAIILAGEGIDSKVDADFWAAADDAILDGVRRGSLRDGLILGVRRAGERLAEFFPAREGDRNEIPDRVIVRRE